MIPNITVNVTVTTPEAAVALLEALRGGQAAPAGSVSVAHGEGTKNAVVAEWPTKAPEPESKDPEPKPEPAPELKEEESAPKYTLEQVRAALMTLPTATAKRLIMDCGVAKLTLLPVEDYPKIMAMIEAAR